MIRKQSISSGKDILKADICVIGGGIAGNYVAMELVRKGFSVIVVERHESLEARPLQCAGIISQKIFNLVSFPSEIILNRIKEAEIFAPDLSHIIMKGKERPVVIDRIKFDAFFGHRAIENGARYLFGTRYLNHWKVKDDNNVLIETTGGYIKSKILIGADGPLSSVLGRFGLQNDYIPAAQVRAYYDYPIHKTAMYFHPRWKELFGYIVPEGNGICRIGLATKNRPDLALKQFLSILKIDNDKIISKQGGLIPYGFPKRFVFDNTVLIGDSASMVKATTGGGIIMLLSAAKVLLPALEKSLENHNYSAEFFISHYQNKITHGFIGLQLKIHFILRLLMENLQESDFKSFFRLYNRPKIRNIIGEYADMDFPLNVALKLLRNREFMQFLLSIGMKNFKLFLKYLKKVYLNG